MASKKKAADLQAAKQRKQKKIVAVGGVLLLALLAIQVPRTLSMLDSGTTPAQATPLPASEAPEAPPGGPLPLDPPAVGGEGAPPPLAATGDEAPLPPAEGQLVSFSLFASKDPFVQQVSPTSPAAGSAGGAGSTAGEGSTGGTGPAGSDPDAPTQAVIAVNGTAETVAVGAEFPSGDPVFRLVRIRAGSVAVAIAGGSYASGDATITLERGKPVTLVNTADGQRYVLELRSVAEAQTAEAPSAEDPPEG